MLSSSTRARAALVAVGFAAAACSASDTGADGESAGTAGTFAAAGMNGTSSGSGGASVALGGGAGGSSAGALAGSAAGGMTGGISAWNGGANGGSARGGATAAAGMNTAGGGGASAGSGAGGTGADAGGSGGGWRSGGGNFGFGGRDFGGGPNGGRASQGGRSSLGGAGGVAGAPSLGGASSGGSGGMSNCPASGHVTYTLSKSANPSAEEQTAYGLITTAMDKATAYYNCYTNITKAVSVSYVASVDTADGNSNGSIRFGSNKTYMDYRTAMHEIAHTVGIGTAPNWSSFVTSEKLFTGTHAIQQLQEINATLATPVDTQLHADSQHFWPYGINQQSEVKSEADLIDHCKMVVAIRQDLGLE